MTDPLLLVVDAGAIFRFFKALEAEQAALPTGTIA